MNFTPLHDRVAIKPIDQEEKTVGGIIIPDTHKEKPAQGEVVAVFATCGGPYATIYEIINSNNINQNDGDTPPPTITTLVPVVGENTQQPPSQSSSTPSMTLSARQIYCDVDDGEIFYTCAFGGRGVATMPLLARRYYSSSPVIMDSGHRTNATTTTTIPTTTTKMNNGIVNFGIGQQCSDDNVGRCGVTVETALRKSQTVVPSNWFNEMDSSSSSSSSSSERIPTIQQQSREQKKDRTTFDTVFQQFPYFSTNKAHTNYVGE